MSSPNLPSIDNIPPSALLSVSRGTIMDNYGYLSGAASITEAGLIELADQSEINIGTDDCRAVTPSGLATFVAANSGTWNSNAFFDLTDVNILGPYTSGDVGAIPVLTEVSAGVFQYELDQPSFTVQDSQVCFDHDFANIDTNLLLPALADYPNATVNFVTDGPGNTFTITPSGGDTIQGLTSAYISDSVTEENTSITLRGIAFNWVTMFSTGDWRTVSGESIPVNTLSATPRYCDNDSLTATITSLNQRDRAYIYEEYDSTVSTGTYPIPANTWTPRRINTSGPDPLSVVASTTFGSYRFSLLPGTYIFNIDLSYFYHRNSSGVILFRIKDVTTPSSSPTLALSNTIGMRGSGENNNTASTTFRGTFTILSTTPIELQQFMSTAGSNVEIPTVDINSSGEPRRLSQIEIEKIS
jgi:hypothetical protein